MKAVIISKYVITMYLTNNIPLPVKIPRLILCP